MATNTIRTLLAIDGEKEFRNKIKACNSELTTMKATVKTLTAEYETNGKQTKTLKDKKQSLQDQTKKLQEREGVLKQAIEKSNDALKKAQAEYVKTVAEKGKDSDESKRLENIIEKLRVKQNSYKTQLANTNTELIRTRAEIRALNDEINSHGIKLADIVSKVKSVTVETGKLGLAGLKTSLKAVTDEVKLGVEGLGAYAAAVTAAAGAIGVFAIKEMGRFYRYFLIEKNFPHHGAVAFGHYGKALYNLFTYLGICPCEIGYNKPASDKYPTENPFN